MGFIKNKKILICIFFGIFVITSAAFALEISWPRSPAGTDLNSACSPITNESCNLPTLVKYFYEWGIALGGLAAFIALLIAGFQYLTSAGNPAQIKDAKDRIVSAFLGLIILLSSFLILNAINPELTTLKIPTVSPPSEQLKSISVEGQPELSKPCEKAIIYFRPNYQNEVMTIPKGLARDVYISKESGSIDIKGNCKVELYQYPGCMGDPMVTLFLSTPDLGTLYLKHDIQCIKVKE